ncbi:MAG TPA: Na+/H+ antiporter subunit E, partial [Hyphomicrobium sp.]|nr:Na+/H+ antiporter subunit E [Hyphomicrobium sp.]
MTLGRWLPYPLLTLALVVMWVLLNSFSLGHVLLGGVIALGASRVMVALQPVPVRIGSWSAIVRLSLTLLYDILRSNIAVASI